MKKQQKEIVIGFLVAIFATLSGMYLYVELFSKHGFAETFQMIEDGDLYGQIITLGAVSNIFVFFVYLKKKQELRAKGVLMATIVIALFTLFTKFI
ncbi:hypothetical protein [Flavicella sediminum]|uniref:hypothetical protein n=1 Tax=Flavicella sediminum TaxID=2585141 RepID=UPI0011200595|nr:hypothetical protein [Flavicella sediminum]